MALMRRFQDHLLQLDAISPKRQVDLPRAAFSLKSRWPRLGRIRFAPGSRCMAPESINRVFDPFYATKSRRTRDDCGQPRPSPEGLFCVQLPVRPDNPLIYVRMLQCSFEDRKSTRLNSSHLGIS